MIDKHNLFYEMKERLSEVECPICLMTLKTVDSFIEGMLYDKVNDHGLRDALIRSRGFCTDHSWRLREYGNPLAHTLIYSHFLEEVLRAGNYALEDEEEPEVLSSNNMRLVLKKLKPEAVCPLCFYEAEAEERYLRSLVNFLQDKEFSAAYSKSFGVCRPHFLRIQKLFCPRDIKRIIVSRFFRTAQELFIELEEVKRKADYRFSGEEAGTERDAWVRVIGFWNGNRT